MPKVKIKVFGQVGEDICELEQAGYLFTLKDRMVMVAGQRVDSHNDLLGLAGRKEYQDRQYIEVVLLQTLAGG